MATVSDWSAATLATYADVVKRYANALSLVSGATEEDQQTKVGAYITLAKDDDITPRLLIQLRPKIVEMDLDADVDILDWINNPEVFKSACVAATLVRIFQDNLFGDDSYAYLAEMFKKEYNEKMVEAINLVEFDQDNDGDIDQVEASTANMGNKFYRS